MDHPFLQDTFIIPWHLLTPAAIQPDIELALANAQQRLDAIADTPLEAVTFDNTLLALEQATEELTRGWGSVGHLDSVANSPALREAYNAMLPKVSEFYTRISLNDKLWQVIKAFAETAEAKALTGTRKRLLEETLEDFKGSGADLPPEKKKLLEGINAELSRLTQKYGENVLDSTNAWELLIEDETRLAGLPQSAKDAARESAKAKGHGTDDKPVWRFTQHMPSLLPVMKYADDEGLRKQVWEGSVGIGQKEPHDNTELVWKILEKRQEKAELLGKDNFADLVLERRMAKTGAAALAFTEDLHGRIKDAFAAEVAELETFKAEQTGQPRDHLQPWEVAYWSEKLRKHRYALDEEELRPYFPIHRVVEGMYALVERIFGVKIVQRPTRFVDEAGKEQRFDEGTPSPDHVVAEVWHPDVKFYDLLDADGTHLGSFYADWYPREPKRGGAWMNYLRTGGPKPDGSTAPHLGLMCGNLNPPVGGKPALMNHRDVETIFHEFGHLLHHLLGKVEIKSLNGVNVAWDFVELPSQIMENWCWEKEALDLFAKHVDSGEPLPAALLDKMLAARNFEQASMTMRQLSFGKMDLDLHTGYKSHEGRDLDAWVDESLEGYRAPLKTKAPGIVRRFTHLFSDPTGYAAGYYSYKWAEVLDADAFTRFKAEGVLNPATGKDFREKILQKGNSEPPEKLFRDFMSRDPDLNALLLRAGLRLEQH
ncbi:MAG: M3 family metallopeptidase [Verrucomicrobiota bacterium JB024]|nr:M3 family metallopeptidase [Verrucomicrobiota bacterium JB024]